MPPLRRLPDRAGIVRALWGRLVADERLTLSEACEARLAAYDWPGNFRQLAGTLKALAALADPFRPVGEDMLPPDILAAPAASPPVGTLDALTVEAMRQAVEACGGNVSQAARRLGVNRSTLYRRLFHA